MNKIKQRQNEQLEVIIQIYCKAKHDSSGKLCADCANLLLYAKTKIEKCPFNDKKPNCGSCKIKCYSKPMQDKIIKIMKYVGPRLVFTHPIMTINHLTNYLKYAFLK